ncbi:MAG: hypothetical protein Q9160_003537 [Pyrenula sp. 1 TL-2023]
MTSDAEDAADALDHSRSESPAADDSGIEQEGGDMAEHPEIKTEKGQNGTKSASASAKDPSRPRRKKARRACFACQRAHLTCGDERPCQRCIKRGLQDACHDGVRKKAKYLHDAPNEALMPGIGGNLFNAAAAMRHSLAIQNQDEAVQQSHSGTYFHSAPQTYNVYPSSQPVSGAQVASENGVSLAGFGQQQSPVAQSFNVTNQPMVNPNLMSQAAESGANTQASWNGALFDPSDPALFNFDLASMNFGNHYGALEFGMLGHMATGAEQTPPSDGHNQRSSISQTNGSSQYTPSVTTFNESPSTQQQFVYNDISMNDWSAGNQNLYGQPFQRHSNGPDAFTIENGPASFTSPDSNSSQQGLMSTKYEDSPTMHSSAYRQTPPTASTTPILSQAPTQKPRHQAQTQQTLPIQPPRQQHPQIPASTLQPVNLPPNARSNRNHRRTDPSKIYDTITAPYSYTSGFHSLISYIQRRFASSPSNTLRIAKALASFRPSFIATTKTLDRDDLIFMEKCFQRTLWEYEGFIEGCGTPTVVARRTGEIVGVGKEFTMVTGWRREVLLGREPNLNVNCGGNSNVTSASATGRAGFNTPQQTSGGENGDRGGQRTPGRPHPVFLAELLDDESVVNFYEDFARLAFGDSRGSVRGHCKLLRYRTKDTATPKTEGDDNARYPGRDFPGKASSQSFHGDEGKVECGYCWTVKRDMFDIPMLIVVNFPTKAEANDTSFYHTSETLPTQMDTIPRDQDMGIDTPEKFMIYHLPYVTAAFDTARSAMYHVYFHVQIITEGQLHLLPDWKLKRPGVMVSEK